MQLGICQFVSLGWHLIDFAMVDHGNDGVFTPAMQPDVVGQVRGTQGLIAFAVHAVTSGTGPKLGFTQ